MPPAAESAILTFRLSVITAGRQMTQQPRLQPAPFTPIIVVEIPRADFIALHLRPTNFTPIATPCMITATAIEDVSQKRRVVGNSATIA